jgi:hypothetical protein
MNAAAARAVALAAHAGQTTPQGDSLVRHLERVAARVSSAAKATAWLHELGESGLACVHELLARGITPVELAALELLTLAEGEDYGLYVRRIARTPGPAGELARTVKLAELSDHLEQLPASSPMARLYRQGREQIEQGQRRIRRRVRAPRIVAA